MQYNFLIFFFMESGMHFLHPAIGSHVPSPFSILNSLNGHRGTVLLRQFLMNRQGLVQTGLIRRFDGCVVFDQRQERSLRASNIHFTNDSLIEPNRKTLYHSANKGREKVLASCELKNVRLNSKNPALHFVTAIQCVCPIPFSS